MLILPRLIDRVCNSLKFKIFFMVLSLASSRLKDLWSLLDLPIVEIISLPYFGKFGLYEFLGCLTADQFSEPGPGLKFGTGSRDSFANPPGDMNGRLNRLS